MATNVNVVVFVFLGLLCVVGTNGAWIRREFQRADFTSNAAAAAAAASLPTHPHRPTATSTSPPTFAPLTIADATTLITSLDAQYTAAFNSKSADQIASFWTFDSIWLGTAGELKGRTAIVAFLAEIAAENSLTQHVISNIYLLSGNLYVAESSLQRDTFVDRWYTVWQRTGESTFQIYYKLSFNA